MADDYLTSDAVIFPCGLYRYRLSRTWDPASRQTPFDLDPVLDDDDE
jgi:hypothetical protein